MYAMTTTWTPLGTATPAMERSCMGCAFGEDVLQPATTKDVILTTIMALVQKHFPQANEAMAQAFAEEIKPELPRLVAQMVAHRRAVLTRALGALWVATTTPSQTRRPRRRRARQ